MTSPGHPGEALVQVLLKNLQENAANPDAYWQDKDSRDPALNPNKDMDSGVRQRIDAAVRGAARRPPIDKPEGKKDDGQQRKDQPGD